MATITTKQEFIDYCLRRLGSPVINIEVSTEQLDDRVDDAVDYWVRNHMYGSEISYYVHTITQAEIDARAITLPDNIFEVHKLLPLNTFIGDGMYSLQYHAAAVAFTNSMPFDTTSYFIRMSSWDLISTLFNEGSLISFNKYKNTVRLDMATTSLFTADTSILIFEVQSAVSPIDNPEAWNDEILKRYAAAMIKKQWGENLKKFDGVTLPGGVAPNGSQIFSEAVEELKEIETEIKDTYQLPPMFLVG